MNQQRIMEIADCLYEQDFFPKMKKIYNRFIQLKDSNNAVDRLIATVLYLNFRNLSRTELKEKAIEIINKEKIR